MHLGVGLLGVMISGILHTMAWAVSASRCLQPRVWCTSSRPSSDSVERLHRYASQFTITSSGSSPSVLSRCPPRNSVCLAPPSRCPILPWAFTSFSASLLISGLRIGKVGASGFSGFSSSTECNGGTMITPEDVLQFWFKDVDPQNDVYTSKVWFAGGPDFDAVCDRRFGECLKLGSTGALNGWKKTTRGRLALVIVLDQISRNVYRDSPSSFSQDQSALNITLETIEQGLDKELTPWERRFLYMPLMHSESLGDHDIADRLYKELADENSKNEQLYKELSFVLEFEKKHSAVIKKFGRYPSRNAVLGRPNTKEEEDFLGSGSGWS